MLHFVRWFLVLCYYDCIDWDNILIWYAVEAMTLCNNYVQPVCVLFLCVCLPIRLPSCMPRHAYMSAYLLVYVHCAHCAPTCGLTSAISKTVMQCLSKRRWILWPSLKVIADERTWNQTRQQQILVHRSPPPRPHRQHRHWRRRGKARGSSAITGCSAGAPKVTSEWPVHTSTQSPSVPLIHTVGTLISTTSTIITTTTTNIKILFIIHFSLLRYNVYPLFLSCLNLDRLFLSNKRNIYKCVYIYIYTLYIAHKRYENVASCNI